MVTIFLNKFGDLQNPSPNLVIQIALFKSIFVFKKNHQNGHDICHQIWWKKSHFFFIYFRFLKENTKMVTVIASISTKQLSAVLMDENACTSGWNFMHQNRKNVIASCFSEQSCLRQDKIQDPWQT